MAKKKDLLTREGKDSCLNFVSGNNNKSVQEQCSKLLDEMQISLDEPIVEDSIDGTRIRLTYVIALSRKGGGIDEDAIKFQYIKEIPVDYSNIPIKIKDSTIGAAASAADDTVSHNNNNNNSIGEETLIESYDELENMFSKDEILTFPSIDLSDKSGLIPI